MSKGKRVKEEGYTIKRSKKRNKALDIFFKLVAFAYVVITIIFYIAILKMDLLPGWVVTIFTIAEIVFTLAMVIGLLKRHKTYKLTVICFIIILFVSGIYLYVTRYALATSSFLGEVLQETTETEDYYIVVRKDSSYNKIEDISNKDVYMFQVSDDVKTKISNKIKVTFNTKDNLKSIGNDLLQKDIDIILVSSTQYNMISEELQDFKSSTKIIYTEKPIKLLEYLIKTYTNENEIVLDNCMGSGTTGIACKNTNRNFIGMEINKDTFELAKKRLSL